MKNDIHTYTGMHVSKSIKHSLINNGLELWFAAKNILSKPTTFYSRYVLKIACYIYT